MFFFTHVSGRPDAPRQPVGDGQFWVGADRWFWLNEEKVEAYLNWHSVDWCTATSPVLAGLNSPYALNWGDSDLVRLGRVCATELLISSLHREEGRVLQEKVRLFSERPFRYRTDFLQEFETFFWIKKEIAKLHDPCQGFQLSNINILSVDQRYFHVKLRSSAKFFVFNANNWYYNRLVFLQEAFTLDLPHEQNAVKS